MAAILGDDAPAFSTVKKWVADFKKGRESLEDDPKEGRPSTATTQKNIGCIHQMVMNDRRLTVNHIANVMNITCFTKGPKTLKVKIEKATMQFSIIAIDI